MPDARTYSHHFHAASVEETRERVAGLDLSADEAPSSTWVLYEDGKHVCNNLPYRYRPLAGDWLAERLGAREAAV